ncbi:hypothetical protein [Rhodococcus sp. IEGM 1379]|uniref:hypothetical protein n=1 Tax=Rhodococcus sp. IEGM 1379 TaxID=3047086 RepID=UPI0024B7F083|nr:hypothetical protein [Rhodococcus sp. IEGM 1379]MDI9915670.1 hypothetical protein [Rhodococcus sp. IEGM 1379]
MGREVAPALEVDTAVLDLAAFENSQEESVEFFETVGHLRKPSVGDPGVAGRDAEFAVGSGVVGTEEVADRNILGVCPILSNLSNSLV